MRRASRSGRLVRSRGSRVKGREPERSADHQLDSPRQNSGPRPSTLDPRPFMLRKLIAGNWKMNTDRAGAVALAKGVVSGADKCKGVDLLVCPPSAYLVPVG